MFLTVVIFVSSIGLTVNAHYCSTTKTLFKSIFTSEISCQHEVNDDKACCKINLQNNHRNSCCNQEIATAEKHDCCSDFSQYYKISLDVEFLNNKPQLIQYIALIVKSISIVQVEDNQSNGLFSGLPDDFPVFPSGKALLTSIHQLKIDLHC